MISDFLRTDYASVRMAYERKTCMKSIFAMVAAAAALSAFAEVKIATVSMVDIVRLHPQHASNRELVKTTDRDYKAKLDAMQESMKALADEGKKAQEDMSNPMLSATAKQDAKKKLDGIQQKFIAEQQEFRMSAQRFQNDLADLESRLIKLETDDIRKKVAAYAKEKGYDLVVDSSTLAYGAENLDVTDDVLRSMGLDPAKRASKDKSSSK